MACLRCLCFLGSVEAGRRVAHGRGVSPLPDAVGQWHAPLRTSRLQCRLLRQVHRGDASGTRAVRAGVLLNQLVETLLDADASRRELLNKGLGDTGDLHLRRRVAASTLLEGDTKVGRQVAHERVVVACRGCDNCLVQGLGVDGSPHPRGCPVVILEPERHEDLVGDEHVVVQLRVTCSGVVVPETGSHDAVYAHAAHAVTSRTGANDVGLEPVERLLDGLCVRLLDPGLQVPVAQRPHDGDGLGNGERQIEARDRLRAGRGLSRQEACELVATGGLTVPVRNEHVVSDPAADLRHLPAAGLGLVVVIAEVVDGLTDGVSELLVKRRIDGIGVAKEEITLVNDPVLRVTDGLSVGALALTEEVAHLLLSDLTRDMEVTGDLLPHPYTCWRP